MKRKALCILVLAALLLAIVFQSGGLAAVDYSTIKVLLVSMGSPTSVTFKALGAYRIAESSNTDIYPGVTYTAKPTSGGVSLSYSDGTKNVTVSVSSTTLTLKQYSNGSSANYLYVDNPGYGWHYYKGDMQFLHASGTSYLKLVNTLFLETYLYGVIAYEMSNSWPVEALKVQAVCARTYALRYVKSNYSNYYQIGDTSSNQVYKGFPLNSDGTPQQNVISAVDATRGQVIVFGDPAKLDLVDGVFSASNGGQIRTAQMHWGSTNTYHVFKDDPYDLKNPSSPKFQYIFPVTADSATLALLTSTQQAEVNTLFGLIRPKAAAALQAKYDFDCTVDDITITGVKSAAPAVSVPGLPAGNHEFTQVNVTVSVHVTGTQALQGRVTTSGGSLNIRKQPDATAAVLGTAPNGALLTVLDTSAATGWYKVQYGSVTGYASSAYITIVQASPSPSPSASPTPSPSPSPTQTPAESSGLMASPSDSPAGSGSPEPSAAATETPAPSAPPTGQQAAPAPRLTTSTEYDGDVDVTLCYLMKDSSGKYTAHGELKTAFSSYNSLIDTSNMWDLYAEQSSDGKFLYVTARGYGHGVGMSQRGAQEMANEGMSAPQILNFYFNFDTTAASVAAVPLTETPLQPIPGHGSSARFATVTGSGVPVRAAASASATPVYTLAQSSRVEVLGTDGDWYHVLYAPAGIAGWACGKSGSTAVIVEDALPTASPSASPSASASPTVSASPTASASPTVSASPSASASPSPTASLSPSASASPTASATPTASPSAKPSPSPSPTATPAPAPTAPPVLTLKPVAGTARVTNYLSLRKTPSTSSSCLVRIPKNAPMTVIQVYTNHIWLKVTYQGKTGYVLAQYVTVAGSKGYRAGTVTATTLNVRSSAGTAYPVMGTLKTGSTAVITASEKVGAYTWYQILVNGGSGWVDSRYIRAS